MKITGTSSSICIEKSGRILKFSGEFIVGGFVAYRDSCQGWEPPYHDQPIKTEDIEEIIKEAIDNSKNDGFILEFE